jgi:Na+-translocating ferredoxin:NAD+ oxidoreductase RnfC subunit
VVGAGGAGFPSYAKLDARADTIILNCAECEPLLKLHRQVLERYAGEILETLDVFADAVGAEQIIIAVKDSYREAVAAVEARLAQHPKTKIGILPEIYPAGDEVVTIYETTGRTVAPGCLPITVGVTVFNVETVYNAWRALHGGYGVTEKYITVAGEVKHPITLRVPLGMTYGELLELAGGPTTDDYVLIAGGPMTGRVAQKSDLVTKTSNAVLVLPRTSYVAQKKTTPIRISAARAAAACCQCRMCTDLCSRNLLGHPIEPHALMRAVASGKATDTGAFLNTFFCSSCGLCEMYSCGQGLSPAALIGTVKGQLRQNGVTPPKDAPLKPTHSQRSYRRVPMSRLTARLGLTRYDKPAPLTDETVSATFVRIPLGQRIGAPATACVTVGQRVRAGDVIGTAADGKLGVQVHASINGTVVETDGKSVCIRA